MELEKLAAIEQKLNLYSDIPAFIRVFTTEINTLVNIKSTLQEVKSLTDIDTRLSELQDKISEYLDIRRQIEGYLPFLPKIQRTILREKYFAGKNWQAVSIAAGLSIRQCQNHNNAALETIIQKGG